MKKELNNYLKNEWTSALSKKDKIIEKSTYSLDIGDTKYTQLDEQVNAQVNKQMCIHAIF